MQTTSLLNVIRIWSICCLVTLWVSIKALWWVALGRNDRERMDGLTRQWARSLVDLVGLRYRVVGTVPEWQPGTRYMVMCSHASHFDIPLSFLALPGSLRMLAKKELSMIPLFGTAMARSDFIFIDRKNRAQALKDLQVARSKMENGIVLWVAPEGTRSTDGRLLPFKQGCFHLAIDTQAVIIPVGIRNVASVLPKGSWTINTGVQTDIHIGAPIDAAAFGKERRLELMKAVETSMRGLLDQTA
jgi:1-acyl-sn-glycerol-3-phosphate acyltransferase